MSPLATIPDVERIASDHLRAHPDIVATGARVVGKNPDSRTLPWVRVTEIDSPTVGNPDHLVEFMIQFDVYAGATGGQPEVNALTRAVRAVMGTLPGSYVGGVVTGVQALGGPRQLDASMEPARDRKILNFIVWAHG